MAPVYPVNFVIPGQATAGRAETRKDEVAERADLLGRRHERLERPPVEMPDAEPGHLGDPPGAVLGGADESQHVAELSDRTVR